ncbi:TPA: hypothetical protein ACNBBG_003107 [Legionella pneumophila]
MKKQHLLLGLGLLASSVLMTACHENPLAKHSTKQNVAFLREAALCAELEMKIGKPKKGVYYSNCMEQNQFGIDCEQFFRTMLACAKSHESYKELTLNELTDKTMYEHLAEDYQIKLFNALDY